MVSSLWVAVRGSWEPLMKASQQCGFGVVEHAEIVVLSADYRFCVQRKVRHTLPEYSEPSFIAEDTFRK